MGPNDSFSTTDHLVYRLVSQWSKWGLINNKIQFKKELKKFLLRGSFCTVEEYLDWTSMHDLHALYL